MPLGTGRARNSSYNIEWSSSVFLGLVSAASAGDIALVRDLISTFGTPRRPPITMILRLKGFALN